MSSPLLLALEEFLKCSSLRSGAFAGPTPALGAAPPVWRVDTEAFKGLGFSPLGLLSAVGSSSCCRRALSLLVGSLQPSKKSSEWRRTLILSSFRVTRDGSGSGRGLTAEDFSGCWPDRLRFSRLHLVDCLSFLFFKAFLLICWVKEFLEGMATNERNKKKNTDQETFNQKILQSKKLDVDGKYHFNDK